MPHAYEGPWVPEQTNAVGVGLETTTYGGDQTGQKRYRINTLGFRGEEFDPDAARRIYVFGCSHAFGVGLNEDEVWHRHFRRSYAEHHGLAEESVNLLNFSHGGASNDFITRQLVTQVAAEPPDLVLANFTSMNRTESHSSGRPLPVGPWMWRTWFVRVLGTLKRSWGRREYAREFYRHLREAHRYYEYYTDEVGMLNALRNMLLVQSFCRARGVEYLATWTDHARLNEPRWSEHTAIAQLMDLLDRDRLLMISPEDPDIRRDGAVDGIHAGPRSHAEFARLCFGGYLERIAERVDAAGGRFEMSSPGVRDQVANDVRRFYEEMPFNDYASREASSRRAAETPLEAVYPDLDRLLRSGRVESVLEIGCGCGWLACGIAHRYGLRVTGVDFTAAALARARTTAEDLGVGGRVHLVESDLFAFDTAERYDLVVSLGVLHHTHDARAAFEHVEPLVASDGAVYLGLYHLYGRRVFLNLFQEILGREGEDAAFAKYQEMDGARAGDPRHLRSWFRDQVLHPHETQHTLEEVAAWFSDCGFALRSTSINRFQPWDRLETLFEAEREYEALSHRANVVEGRYFPGFFTALGDRR